MKALLLLCFALISSGCATCEQHPVWCAVGTAVIVGSIAAAAEHHHDQQRQRADLCGPGSPNRASAVIGLCASKQFQIPFVHPIGHGT